MREIVHEAIRQCQDFNERFVAWVEQYPHAKTLPKSLEHEIVHEQQQVCARRDHLHAHLAQVDAFASVRAVDDSGIAVAADETRQNVVTIAVARYAPLVTVTVRGNVPDALMQQVAACLDACEMTRLTDTEIDAIQHSGLYEGLFE